MYMTPQYHDLVPADVVVRNVDVRRPGQLLVFIFLESGFPKDHSQAVHACRALPVKRELTLGVEVPRAIDFAVKVLHDEDMDSRVTKNWTGYVPKEGLGFSAGATILRGAPSFKRARIRFVEDEAIEIAMRYPGGFGI